LASVVRAHRQPSFSAPTRQSSGTSTSSKNTSLNISWPVSSRNGRTSMPGVRMSSMKHEMPSCFGASGSVRARQMPQSACCAIDVQTFWPFSNQPPSVRVALVDSDARSEPAPGSLNSWHHVSSPRRVGRIQRSCCASLPYTIRVGNAHAPTMIDGRRTFAAANSSSITSSSSAEASRPHGFGHEGVR
jgi:hypothetical protein